MKSMNLFRDFANDGSCVRLVKVLQENVGNANLDKHVYVYTMKSRWLLEDAPMVDILTKADLIMLDGEDVLISHDYDSKLNILSNDKEANG